MRYLIIILFSFAGFSQPTNFRDYKVRQWHAEFDWTAESGAVSYEIFKDNILHGTSNGTTYVAANLQTDTNHIFKIRSVFSNGSKSAFSYEINVRTGLYPAERTAFSTIPYTDPPDATNRNSSTNAFGLFQKPITNDVDYPRGNNSDYWGYPRIATFTIDELNMGSVFPYIFWGTDDFERNSINTPYERFSLSLDEPNTFYGNGNNRTFTKSVNGTNVFSREFTQFNAAAKLMPTAEDGGPSWDNHIWALQNTNYSNDVIVYNSQTNSIIAEFDTGVDVLNGWVSISPSGQYLVVARQYASVDGSPNFVDIYTIGSSSVTFLRRDTYDFGHADLGVSMQGNDVLVYRWGGWMMMKRLDNGAETTLLGGNTSNTWFLIGHISCKNVLQPGWAYVNNNDDTDYNTKTEGSPRKLSYSKILGVKLDENANGYGSTIFREYTFSDIAASGYATPSPSGEMIAVNSLVNSGRDVGVFLQQQNLIGDEIPFDGTPPPVGPPIASVTRKKASTFTGIN